MITDASNKAVGAVLVQEMNGVEKPVAFYSSLLNSAQKNYSATDKELLAVVKSVKHFRPYLIASKWLFRTDHQAITYLFQAKDLSTRLLRWSLQLQEYDFTIEYVKGENNIADPLSRLVDMTAQVNMISKARNLIRLEKVDAVPILADYHLNTGRGSAENMKYNILRKYVWSGCNKDINRWVDGCEICQKGKRIAKKSAVISIETANPLELWEVDLVGPLGESKNGFKYILTIIDHYTRYARAYPLKSKTGKETARRLRMAIEEEGDSPLTILSDNGLEFVNPETKRMAEEFKIVWKHSSPYHPTTTGSVERFNQTLIQKLRKLTIFGKHD